MTRLWWVRHGPTHQRAFCGWRDVPADLSDHAALDRLSAFLPPGARAAARLGIPTRLVTSLLNSLPVVVDQIADESHPALALCRLTVGSGSSSLLARLRYAPLRRRVEPAARSGGVGADQGRGPDWIGVNTAPPGCRRITASLGFFIQMLSVT